MDLKNAFFNYQAQTTLSASGFEVSYAQGNYLYGKDQKKYLDFVAGVSANTLGHSHPKVILAIKEQADRYLHVMVYGEYALEKPVKLCEFLAKKLPDPLKVTYLVNSGTEAIEAALKLAKRYTNREEIISFKNSYHGNSQGSLSVSGNEIHKQAFRPLIPNIRFIEFNNESDLEKISNHTASVIIETIQGAAGFCLPKNNFLLKLKQKCEKNGALLILDEIQPGIGRTGKLFAFEHYGIIPDILVIGKGLGGGLPVGAMISSKKIMNTLCVSPKLGHITTFGGNPLIAAASLATLTTLYEENLMELVEEKEKLFRKLLIHKKIKKIHGKGLMLALELESEEYCLAVVKKCMNKGLIVFWQLYRNNFLRISPPLTISLIEIKWGCSVILDILNEENSN